LKAIYYVTDHGLGHASRTIAITRELLKKKVNVIIRNDDPLSFFRQSLLRTKITTGQTDFGPVMDKNNPMKIDDTKTREKISKWIKHLPSMIEKESKFITKERPDVIISDVSVMPILLAKRNGIESVAVSNFVWSDTLKLDNKQREFLENAYNAADLVIKLPFGSEMKFQNKKEYGLVARNITETRTSVRKKLKISDDEKLVIVALGGFKEQIPVKKGQSVKILDISDYATVMKLKKTVNFVEGQNLINASDLVICKCGYGFTSECLSNNIPFRYILESTHSEAFGIHRGLQKLGLDNKLSLRELQRTEINEKFIKNTNSNKVIIANQKVAQAIMKMGK
jgi:UDP-N-acetylglucosamine:LPS N-acetylglucosamine transferase